jgi:signal transduction histidine kinase/flagellar basal body-associated protein FliL
MESNNQTQFRGRIRFTLLLTFIILAIIPPALLVPFILGQTAQQAEEQVKNQLESVAELKTAQIDAYLANGTQVLQLIVSEEELYEALEGVSQDDANHTAELSGLLAAYLAEKLEAQTAFRELFIYDEQGIIHVSTNPTQLNKRVSNLPYFEPSLSGIYTQPPYYEVSTSDLNMIFTVPIINEDGEVVGVLAGRADLAVLSQIMLTRNGLGETGETYLISLQNSYLLTESRFEGYALNRSYRSDGITQALEGKNGAGKYIDYRDEAVIGVYRWIPELQSGLLAEITEEEALANIRNLTIVNIIVGAIIVAGAIIVGFLFARWISRPIIDLAHSAVAFAKGDYSQRTAIRRKNEIGQLGQAFNQMANAVEQRQNELQDLNQSLKKARDEALASQRIANENSRLKSEFLSMMSHELRTPMNAIEGFTGIMLKKMAGVEYNEKTERYLNKVQSNSRRLLGLINDFLDLSRIESGRLELASMPISPTEMVQKWRDNLIVLADNKGLAFEVKVDPTLPQTIYGDEESISKIAINLVGNAIKFTEKGTVSLSLERQDSKMALIVHDTGIGIPPHAREFVFDEFRQVDQSSKRVHGGTGLGLAIVQKLAREMDGTVTLQSEVGVGSTFTVLLPIQTQQILS